MKSKVVREPIATWWRVESWSIAITPVQVVAFTASFVTFLEKKFAFQGPDMWQECRSNRDDFFASFEEAKAEYLRRATKHVEDAKEELQRRRSRLGAIASLQPDIGKPLEK